MDHRAAVRIGSLLLVHCKIIDLRKHIGWNLQCKLGIEDDLQIKEIVPRIEF